MEWARAGTGNSQSRNMSKCMNSNYPRNVIKNNERHILLIRLADVKQISELARSYKTWVGM